MRLIVPLLAATAVLAACADEPPQLAARELLDRAAKAYAGCKSYHDSGVVKTVFVQPDRTWTSVKPFTTAFVRPDRFRFEFTDTLAGGDKSRYVVWANGKDVQTWWDIKPGVEKPESLGRALAAATGVSSGSARTVPAMLLPGEVWGGRVTDLTDPKRLDDAKLGQADCFRVEGTYADQPLTLWIDKTTFLVRRIDGQRKFDAFRTEETTTYDPAIDGEVPDKELEFDLPKPK